MTIRQIMFTSLFFAVSCASSSDVRFESATTSKIGLVSESDFAKVDKVLGETPAEISYSDISGRIVRLQAPGRQNVDIFFPPEEETDDAVFRINARLAASDNNHSSTSINLPFRLALQAQKAIADGDYQEAKVKIEELRKIDERLAAPDLLEGLLHFRMKRPKMAIASFQAALAKDPSDTDLPTLIKVATSQ